MAQPVEYSLAVLLILIKNRERTPDLATCDTASVGLLSGTPTKTAADHQPRRSLTKVMPVPYSPSVNAALTPRVPMAGG
jgi:hypothetical protein